ncbi:DegT/DnrJ/EryC1/StrS family aminotransferase [candidate division KSB1 bacterium]
MNIPITKPFFDDREQTAAAEVINSGWVAQGPKTEEFEKQLSDYIGCKYSIGVSSGTTALHLCLIALGIGNGDEVIVPSYSFIASANVILHAGAVPVFVDIDPRTYNLDPDKIREKITGNTRAIIAVHQVGLPADLDEINQIAKQNGLFVIEDAACAIGSEYRSVKIGCSDNLVCFSFHPRKVITTGEGGAISSNNDSLEEKIRILRNQGMSRPAHNRHTSDSIEFEQFPVIGYNYRITDIQSAIGIIQLSKLNEIIEKRRKLADRYNKAFENNKYLTPPFIPDDMKTTYQSYILRISDSCPISRNEIMQKLMENGIAAKRGIQAIHTELFYVDKFRNLSLPETEKAVDSTLIIPLYPQMTDEEQEYVINIFNKIFN